MLVWLAEHLVKYYSGFNVFSYLTFRAIVSLLTALFISLWMGPRMIARLQKLSFGQVVRNDGPESHFSKRGTPTMGGLMFIAAIAVVCLTVGFEPMMNGDWGHIFCFVFALIFGADELAQGKVTVKSLRDGEGQQVQQALADVALWPAA